MNNFTWKHYNRTASLHVVTNVILTIQHAKIESIVWQKTGNQNNYQSITSTLHLYLLSLNVINEMIEKLLLMN